MAESLRFTVKPRSLNDGFELTSSALPFPMWYGKLDDAINYAIQCLAETEWAVVDVFDETGELIVKINHRPEARQRGTREYDQDDYLGADRFALSPGAGCPLGA